MAPKHISTFLILLILEEKWFEKMNINYKYKMNIIPNFVTPEGSWTPELFIEIQEIELIWHKAGHL